MFLPKNRRAFHVCVFNGDRQLKEIKKEITAERCKRFSQQHRPTNNLPVKMKSTTKTAHCPLKLSACECGGGVPTVCCAAVRNYALSPVFTSSAKWSVNARI